MRIHISHSLEETVDIAKDCLENVSRSASTDSATVIGLSGHLGAGKTAFVKIVGKLLGVQEEITSPTFVIMKIYGFNSARLADAVSSTSKNEEENGGAKRADQLPWTRLVHIDAYRLERREELDALNFEQLVADPNNLILVEWPENVDLKSVVNDYKELKFEIKNNTYSIMG